MMRDWRTWLSITVLVAGLFLCYVVPAFAADRITYEAPPPFVRANMIAVEATMITLGYDVDGYNAIEAPRVMFVESLPNGDYGAWEAISACDAAGKCRVVGGLIKLSERQPGACLLISLAHELGHDASVRMGLIDDVPNQEVKPRLAAISANVENTFGSFEYRPNCLDKRRLRR